MEGLVFAETAYQDIKAKIKPTFDPDRNVKDWDDTRVTPAKEKVLVSHDWDEVRRLMWDYVGIVRTDKRLKRALRRIKILKQEIYEYYYDHKLNADLLELRNLAQVAELMIKSALKRKESRGLNFNLDYPFMKKRSKPTTLMPKPHDKNKKKS